MRTRSQSRNSNRQQQQVNPTFVEPFNLVEPIENQAPSVVTMDDTRTMAQLLEAPTVGYEDAIVVPEITADNFELKHSLLTLVQNKQFFGHDKEDPHAHIRYFNKITSTMKFPNVLRPTIPTTSSPPKVVKRESEVTKDTMLPTNNGSTKDVQPPIVQVQPQVPNSEPVVTPVNALMPNLKLSIQYPSRPLIGNKEKLSKMARTPLNEHCLVVILNKLPEKLGDPSKFLIPYDFPRMDKCLALADLCASINLMPLSVWKKLSLPELTPTCMTLELAETGGFDYIPIRDHEDVYLKVGKF
ncbi:hypothetical protein Tco_1171845 [Tanacetum coccineum]